MSAITHKDSTTLELHVEGMHCASCAANVQRALMQVEGVSEAAVSHSEERARVLGDSVQTQRVLDAVRSAGYSAQIAQAERSVATRRTEIERVQQGNASRWKRLLIFGLAGTVPIHLIHWVGPLIGLDAHSLVSMWTIAAIATLVQVVVGSEFYRSAWSATRVGRTNMDTLIAIGSTAAFVLSWVSLLAGEEALNVPSYFGESAGLLTLVSLGHWIEARTTSQAGSAVRELLSLQPDQVTVLGDEADNEGRVAETEDVREGDLTLLRPGERVAVDGHIVRGASAFDESIVTGESMPVNRAVGDEVVAGSINLTALAVVRTSVDGKHTTVARIAEMVQAAQLSRTEIQRLADRVSAVFVPAVLSIAVITAVVWIVLGGADAIGRGVIAATTVLIISCPCALGLATPTAVMVGAGEASKRGVFIKSAHVLELLSRVNAIFFDKTGTLTRGKPSVISGDDDVVATAATVASGSTHPLSKAIVEAADARDLTYQRAVDIQEEAGVGLSGVSEGKHIEIVSISRASELGHKVNVDGEGVTGSVVLVDGSLVGAIGFFDSPRDDARATVKVLRDHGVRTVILSGDRAEAALAAARQVGIDAADVYSGLAPEDKVEHVRAIENADGVCGFVGDGINDAAALAAVSADGGVAIAMGTGSNVAVESADVVIPGEHLASLVTVLDLGRRTLVTIKQNLFFSFVYNSIAIPAAAFGLLGMRGPLIAALAMAMSDVCVVGNSLRLKAKLARERKQAASLPPEPPAKSDCGCGGCGCN